MEEQLIEFKTAVLAKEKGFYLVTRQSYNPQGTESTYNYLVNHPNCSDMFPRPPQSLLQKWLREEHNLHVESTLYYTFKPGGFGWDIRSVRYELGKRGIQDDSANKEFATYEEALEHGLFAALKLIETE